MKDKKVIVYIVLCIIIIGMIGYLVYLKANNDEKVVDTGSKEPVNSKAQIVELINTMTANDQLEGLYSGKTYIIDNISNTYILKSILNSIKSDRTLSTDELRNISARLKVCINSSYYSEENVKKNITKIYGDLQLDYAKEVANTGFVYDSVEKSFYELCNNKLETNNFVTTYLYDYKEKTNEANAYIAVAYGTKVPVVINGATTDKTTINIYKTSARDKVYKTYVKEPGSKEEFKLNKDNYKDFSKFKFTFVKENGEYHFNSINMEN